MALDELMHNRASLNSAICLGMAGLEESWGIKVTRYEVGASNEYPRGYRFQILKSLFTRFKTSRWISQPKTQWQSRARRKETVA